VGGGDLYTNWRAVVFDSELEFAGSMLVEYGGYGIQSFAKLGEAFLDFDGFGFVHFRCLVGIRWRNCACGFDMTRGGIHKTPFLQPVCIERKPN
jgi:hypothetical protein